MASSFVYPEILIDLGVSYIEGFATSLGPSEIQTIRQTFNDYLNQRINYDQCRCVLLNSVGRDDSLARIRDIINLSDEPIPYTDDGKEDKLSLRKKTRTWTVQEDQRLLGGVARYGLDNWQMVANFLGNGRNRAQCSQRWTRGLDPRISKKSWSSEEEEKLLQLVKQYGDKAWTKIASALGNRSDVQCRYHFKQLVNEHDDVKFKLRKSQTSDRFQWKQTPQNEQQQQSKQVNFMTLRCGKSFGSQPAMIRQNTSVLYDSSPIGNFNHQTFQQIAPINHIGISPQIFHNQTGQAIRWDILGNDQQELDNFLSRFR